MANRSLGTLTLDLIARIGGWQSGLDQASRIAKTRGSEIERTFARLGGVVKGLLGTFSAGFVINKFIQETSHAQSAIAQLGAVIQSTGNSAGFTQDQLVEMSKEIQRTTRFSDEMALSVQTTLLSMTRLKGERFDQALRLVADAAVRSGKDMDSVGIIFGRALSGAARGVEGLRKVGVRFTQGQIEQIRALAKTNQTLKLQELILKQVETAVGGAAAADIKTLGGAIANLKNQFDELFEVESSNTSGIVAGINLLANNLELLAGILTKAAIAYGIYKATLIGAEVATATKNFVELFKAIKAGNAVLISTAAADAASVLAKQQKVVATAQEVAAEEARLAAIVVGNRATVQRIVLDEASTASAATRATVLRNLARSEAALAAAQTATARANAAVATGAAGAAAAQTVLNRETSKGSQLTKLLLGPLAGVIAFARANPYVAIAAAIGTVIVALTSFSDEIKLSEDGVITLANATKAAVQLMGEAWDDLKASVKATVAEFRSFAAPVLDPIINSVKAVIQAFEDWGFSISKIGVEFGKIIKLIPGVGQAIAFVESAGAAIAKRAREIAAEEERLKKAAEAAAAAAAKAKEEEEARAAASKEAVKKIEDMITALRTQVATFEQGAVAAAKYRIEQGDLKDDFAKVGAAANGYKRELLALTAIMEKVQAAKTIREMADDLEKQIALFGKGETAAFEYALAQEDVQKALALLGPAAAEAVAGLRKANDEVQKLKIAEKLREINIQILELRGQSAQAIALKFDADFKELREEMERLGNVEGLALLQLFRDMTVANAEFNQTLKETTKITDELAAQEERIRNNLEVGAITQLESLFAIDEARKQAIERLKETLVLLEQIPELLRSEETIKNIQNITREIENLEAQVGLLGKQIEGEMKDQFSNALGEWLKGTKSLDDAFRDMVNNIKNYFLDLIAQNFAEQLFGAFKTAGGGGGIGAFFASLFKFDRGGFLKPGQFGIAGEHGAEIIYGGKAGASIVSRKETEGMFKLIQKLFGMFPTRDQGGMGYAGQPVVIGPNARREIFVPQTNGRFYPRQELGSQTNQFNFSFPGFTGTISRRTEQQIAAAAARGVADANRRNN